MGSRNIQGFSGMSNLVLLYNHSVNFVYLRYLKVENLLFDIFFSHGFQFEKNFCSSISSDPLGKRIITN